MAATEHEVQRSELRWAVAVSLFVLVIFGLTLFAALALHRNPPSNLERIDPATLHLTGEFTEPNLGTRVEQNGQVTTRIVATQFAFVPPCVARSTRSGPGPWHHSSPRPPCRRSGHPEVGPMPGPSGDRIQGAAS